MSTLYRIENLYKSYSGIEEELHILKDVNIRIDQGSAVSIIGASGSGKSTLLHLLGALDKPTSGKIFFKDSSMSDFSPEEQARFRNRSVGFVFQFHHLLPEFTTLENVAMPGLIGKQTREKSLSDARLLLERVGLAHRLEAKPSTLSGGERQRAAIARALLLKPEVILADEPTGNLDESSGRQITDLLVELNRELGMSLVIVTHNQDIARQMDQTLELRNGALYEKAI